MNLKQALATAKKFVIYGEPNGDFGTFEPLKATYDDENDIWEVKCRYYKYGEKRTVNLEIDDESREILSFEMV